MKRSATFASLAAAAVLALGAGSALAKDHDNGHGHGKGHDKQEKHESREQARDVREVRPGAYFTEEQRVHVRHYTEEHYGHGAKGCPPGLAKKHNGCMPPGQARRWAVGERVPAGVTVYAVPQPVLVQLPPAPVGFRYQRVGGDVVLVRINGNVVVDIMLNIFG